MKQARVLGLSQRELEEFRRWCLRHSSEETCRQYERKLLEIDQGLRPIDASRWHITAYKRLMRFRCEEKQQPKACEEFRRVKSRRSSQDLRVPSDEEVLQAISSPLGWLYKLLVESGLRLTEVLLVLEKADRLEWHEESDFARVLLAWERGSKRAFWGYFLARVEPRLGLSEDRLQDMRQALGLPGFKYMRKWAATKMYEAGCGEAEIDFIQGRAPETVLRKHYLSILKKADECYRRYAAWLRGFLSLSPSQA